MSRTEQGGTSGRRILIADDEPGVRDALRLLLRLDGYTVIEACNGREALALFALGGFALVITDYLMPGLRGDELAREIKRRAPGQPVLMITAHLDVVHLSKNPVDAVLGKPFALNDLRRTVSELVG